MNKKAFKLKATELTPKELELIFDVGTMTIVNYRKGSKRISPLPHKTVAVGEERHRVVFTAGRVRQWAKKNRIEIVREPEVVVSLRKE